MTLSPETRRALARGIALYEAGAFWDAHEAWEEAWQEESGQPRLLLQGLIQAAAALHKAFVQRQPASCVKLFLSALEKLDPLPADLGDLELARFRDACRRAAAHAELWSRGEVPFFDPAQTPKIKSVRPPL